MGSRADLRHPRHAPAPGPRLRTPARHLGVTRVLGDERRNSAPADRHHHPHLARRKTDNPQLNPILEQIDTREQALSEQAEQTRTRIEELAAHLRELDEETDNLRITRKTLLGIAHHLAVAEAAPPPATPDHPAYQQFLAAFADTRRPMRARDLCEALDLPILPENTEGIRSKLKRMVSRGILTEPEPGLFTQPHP
ncbi:hypothetical protein [Streptomyces violaceusniger]|uniref:hypothetical protein n=1 Tax=Streptomyces violaceusniger TaxID=68280 RepID=UPI0038044434